MSNIIISEINEHEILGTKQSTSKRSRCSMEWLVRNKTIGTENFCKDSHLKLENKKCETNEKKNKWTRQRQKQSINQSKASDAEHHQPPNKPTKRNSLSAKKTQANRLAWSNVLELEPAFLARFTDNLGSLVEIMLHLLSSLFHLLLETTHLPSFLLERDRQTWKQTQIILGLGSCGHWWGLYC